MLAEADTGHQLIYAGFDVISVCILCQSSAWCYIQRSRGRHMNTQFSAI